jgi:hypothetical protein
MEDFSTAVQLYEELAKSRGSVDYEAAEDILVNYLASRAQNTWLTGVGQGKDPFGRSQDTYEACFNRAYESAVLGKFQEAEELLKRSNGMNITTRSHD